MKKLNIDYRKLGEGFLSMLRSNSGTIFGGLSMIGLAMICKKLDIPFNVLTEPNGNIYNNRTSIVKTQDTSLMMLPSNPIEASMAAICDTAKATNDSYYKNIYADKIVNVLENADKPIEPSTVTYAIMCIKAISSSTNDDWYKNAMMKKITKITNLKCEEAIK